MRLTVLGMIISLLCIGGLNAVPSCGTAPADPNSPSVSEKESQLQAILDRLQENASKLISCTAKIEYLFIQDPELLNSHSLRKGMMYYLKNDDRSWMRINLDTLKEDDFDEEERREVYLFDGVWTTKVDYTLEQVDKLQQAPEEKPLDAFDFISHYFPLVGFSGSRQFETEFDVRLGQTVQDDPNLICLHLDVKEDSRYSKDYKAIDFWIDKEKYLPRRVRAVNPQGDIFDIRFVNIQTNKKMKMSIFTIETPDHFRHNIEALKQEPEPKGQD